MNTTLDTIAHRQHARRLRDLAFSFLLAAVAAFSIATIGTAGADRQTAEAATIVAPAPVEMDACAIELAC